MSISGRPRIDIDNRPLIGSYRPYFPERIKVDCCPICGSACLPGSREIERHRGFNIRDGHCYSCHNLDITFCDHCLIGEGGVDIICRVVEANEDQRKKIATDAYTILKEKHDEALKEMKLGWIGIAVIIFTLFLLLSLISD